MKHITTLSINFRVSSRRTNVLSDYYDKVLEERFLPLIHTFRGPYPVTKYPVNEDRV